MLYRRAKERLRRPPVRPSRLSTPSTTETPSETVKNGAVEIDLPASLTVLPPEALETLTLWPVLQQEGAVRILGRGLQQGTSHRADVICFSIIDWRGL